MEVFNAVAPVRGNVMNNAINNECHEVYEWKYLNVLPELSVLHQFSENVCMAFMNSMQNDFTLF